MIKDTVIITFKKNIKISERTHRVFYNTGKTILTQVVAVKTGMVSGRGEVICA